MAISKTNIQAIRNVLHTDMQRRIFKQYNERKDEFHLNDEDYDRTQSSLSNNVESCNNMNDINELLVEYNDLFTSYDELLVPTIDGTLNYVVGSFVSKLNYLVENNG